MFEEHDPKVLLAQDKSACDGYGYRRGTDAYAQCLQLRDEARQAHDDAARARVAAGFRQLGADMTAQSIANRPTTCNTFGTAQAAGYGTVTGNSTTTCY